VDSATLVNIDVEKGRETLRALEAVGMRVPVALWLHMSDYNDWRLALSSPEFPGEGLRKAYESVHAALRSAGKTVGWTPPLLLFRTSDPFICDLRRLFAKTGTVEGVRLGGQLIGDRFINDAYVYRIK